MEIIGQVHAPDALPKGKQLPLPIGWGLGGPRAILDVLAKRKFHCPSQKSNPTHPFRCLDAVLTDLLHFG